MRHIARLADELECFVCDRATPPIIEKLRTKGVAMHAYGVSVYYAYTGNQLNGLGRSRSDFDYADCSSMPKKVSEPTVVG